MHHPAANSELLQSYLDVAMISIARVSAVASLLSVEDVASAFSQLSPLEQVFMFGSFEADLQKACTALLRAAGANCAAPNAEPHDRRR